jgi:hypothetical protein
MAAATDEIEWKSSKYLFCYKVKKIYIANPVLLLNPPAMHSGPILVYSSVFLFNSCNFLKMAECYVCLFIFSFLSYHSFWVRRVV